MKTLGAALLVMGGLVHLIPALYDWLSELTGGTGWIQMIVGAISIVVGIALVIGSEEPEAEKTPHTKLPT